MIFSILKINTNSSLSHLKTLLIKKILLKDLRRLKIFKLREVFRLQEYILQVKTQTKIFCLNQKDKHFRQQLLFPIIL